jgi:hypothetical protein
MASVGSISMQGTLFDRYIGIDYSHVKGTGKQRQDAAGISRCMDA